MFNGLKECAGKHIWIWRYLWYSVAFLFGAGLLAVCVVSSRRAFSNQYSNHWGFDTFLLGCSCVVPVVWALAGLGLRPRAWRALIILGVLAGVTMIGLFIFHHYNVLVNYDTWLERGMPERWTH